MSKIGDGILAGRIETWLLINGCGAVSVTYADSTYYVTYTLKLDMKPQPAIKIKDGAISFPTGSQQLVVDLFLKSLMGG